MLNVLINIVVYGGWVLLAILTIAILGYIAMWIVAGIAWLCLKGWE